MQSLQETRKKRTDPLYPWMLIHPHPNNLPEGNKNGKFLTWLGLNNKQLLNHISPSIATALVSMDQ